MAAFQARGIFEALSRDTTETIMRHANFEFRQGNVDKAKAVYKAGAEANTVHNLLYFVYNSNRCHY